MDLKRVVVTGMGAITPVGNTVSEFWESIKNGVSGAGPITHFNPEKFKSKFACEVKNFDPLQYIDKKELRKLDIFVQYTIAASDQALSMAGINKDNTDLDRAGVIIATGCGGFNTMQQEIMEYANGDGSPRFSPFYIPKIICDIAAGHVSIRNNLRGPNFAIVSACASSNNAVTDASMYLRLNKADVMICGGTETCIVESAMGSFNNMKALSERNDDYATASRPYDLDRDGFVMGEGSGILVLETLDHALARGANIICELAGAGASADAYHITAPHPQGEGALRAMKAALEDANMKVEEIDYINTHGTSTQLGDIAEVKSIEKLLGDHIYNINISSTKSMTGHCIGATGAIEAIASIKAITEGIIPPTINHFTDDPAFDPRINFTFNTAQQRKVNVALTNGFGFGGHNSTLIFKKYVA